VKYYFRRSGLIALWFIAFYILLTAIPYLIPDLSGNFMSGISSFFWLGSIIALIQFAIVSLIYLIGKIRM